jgi:hypothetical protein
MELVTAQIQIYEKSIINEKMSAIALLSKQPRASQVQELHKTCCSRYPASPQGGTTSYC